MCVRTRNLASAGISHKTLMLECDSAVSLLYSVSDGVGIIRISNDTVPQDAHRLSSAIDLTVWQVCRSSNGIRRLVTYKTRTHTLSYYACAQTCCTNVPRYLKQIKLVFQLQPIRNHFVDSQFEAFSPLHTRTNSPCVCARLLATCLSLPNSLLIDCTKFRFSFVRVSFSFQLVCHYFAVNWTLICPYKVENCKYCILKSMLKHARARRERAKGDGAQIGHTTQHMLNGMDNTWRRTGTARATTATAISNQSARIKCCDGALFSVAASRLSSI